MSLSFSITRPAAAPLRLQAPALDVFDPGAMVRFGATLALLSLLACIGIHEAGRLTVTLATVLPAVACGGGALASLGVLVHCLRALVAEARA